MDRNLLWPRTIAISSVAVLGLHFSAPAVRSQFQPTSGTSADSIELIKQHEGLRLQAYRDPVGVWTIGYGHTKTAKPGMTITEQKAEELLRQDLQDAERAVEQSIRKPLAENEKAALTSLAFNVGEGAIASSTLVRKLNAGDKSGAAAEFRKWNKGSIGGRKKVLPGLTKRRQAEAQLFKGQTP